MTELTSLQKKVLQYLEGIECRFYEPMAKHTSFRIGGPAEVMAFPKTGQELSELLKAAKKLECKISILGAGTNILAPDNGVNGLVVCLKEYLNLPKTIPQSKQRLWLALRRL